MGRELYNINWFNVYLRDGSTCGSRCGASRNVNHCHRKHRCSQNRSTNSFKDRSVCRKPWTSNTKFSFAGWVVSIPNHFCLEYAYDVNLWLYDLWWCLISSLKGNLKIPNKSLTSSSHTSRLLNLTGGVFGINADMAVYPFAYHVPRQQKTTAGTHWNFWARLCPSLEGFCLRERCGKFKGCGSIYR